MRVTQILTVALLGAASSMASAGELGPTSRGTISISITIPPHVMVKPVSLVNQDHPSSLSDLCVATNGLQDFHLMVVDSASGQERAIPSPVQVAPGQGSCRGPGLGFQIVDEWPLTAKKMPDAASPLTLLVVPD